MLQQTKGIVLRSVNFSETSLITTIYTEKLGVQSYLIKGARRPKSKLNQSFFRPLNLLDLIVYYRDNKNLLTIKEVSFDTYFKRIPFEITHSSLAIFIAEILNKSLKSDMRDEALYHYIESKIKVLDHLEDKFFDFNQRFLFGLTHNLGFHPQPFYSDDAPYFNYMDGEFNDKPQVNSATVIESNLLKRWIKSNSGEQVTFTTAERRQLIRLILIFYGFHLEKFGKVKSLEILETIFS